MAVSTSASAWMLIVPDTSMPQYAPPATVAAARKRRYFISKFLSLGFNKKFPRNIHPGRLCPYRESPLATCLFSNQTSKSIPDHMGSINWWAIVRSSNSNSISYFPAAFRRNSPRRFLNGSEHSGVRNRGLQTRRVIGQQREVPSSFIPHPFFHFDETDTLKN